MYVGGLVKQIWGRHLRMTWGQEVCYASLVPFTTQWTSIPTGLGESMVALGEPGDGYVLRDVTFACRIHPAAQRYIREQLWVTGWLSICVNCCMMVGSVPWWLSLSCLIQSDHLLIADRMDRNILMAIPSTFLKSMSWWGHYWKMYLFFTKHDDQFTWKTKLV